MTIGVVPIPVPVAIAILIPMLPLDAEPLPLAWCRDSASMAIRRIFASNGVEVEAEVEVVGAREEDDAY